MNKQILILCFSLFISGVSFVGAASADEATLKPIEVTATRTTLKEENKTSAVTIITQEEIQKKQHMQVQDILREQLGIQVVRSGPLGSQTSIFMRGAGSQSTLVMIDGIQVNLNTSGGFNFAHLQMDNIERIEILRGPQSTLWGADAVGGVINIVTKKGKGGPTHSIGYEVGSYKTFKETVTSSGAFDKFDYSLSASRADSVGFSSYNEERGATEDDGYENMSLSSRLGYGFMGDGRVDMITRYTRAKNDFDGSDPFTFAFSDTLEERSTSDHFTLAVPIQKSITDQWDVKLISNLSYNKSDNINPLFGDSTIYNRTYTVDFQNNVVLTDYLSTVFGLEYQLANGRSTFKGNPFLFFPIASSQGGRTNHSEGYYMEGRFNYEDRAFLTAGFRQDVNSEFEDKLTYKVEAAYLFKKSGTKLRASHATGFRAPTINELFFEPFNNPNLKPETSKNWEAGIEQKLFGDRLTLAVNYFHTDYTNLIVFVDIPVFPFSTPRNVGLATSQGVESSLNLKIIEDLDLTVLHTWNQAVDDVAHETLPRRPRNTLSVTLSHLWQKKLGTTVTAQYRSSMDSSSFATGDKLSSRTLLRTAVSYQLNKNLKLTARGENLLDEVYEEPFQVGTAGISGYGGLVYTFN